MNVHLSDGSFFALHAEVFAASGLSAGAVIDEEIKERLLDRSERVRARVQALRLLSRAGHTRRGLARKLSARGFSPGAVRHAMTRMIELGYLDDRAFAESWMRSRLSMGKEGGTALYRGLLSRGVARPLAEEVVKAMYSHEAEVRDARRLVAGLPRGAAMRRLAGRGFRSRAIAAVIRGIPETAREQAEE